jgi:probable F420-dependent oxidoreductase
VSQEEPVPKPFHFAVQSYASDSAASWRATARKVEALGYSTLHLADHYLGPGPALAATHHAAQSIAAVPAMAVAAEATRSLRVGCRVFCIDYHHPVVLAKELATLDLLSEGRIEVGLGAGWLDGEYRAMGIPFDPPAARIGRLAAVVDLLRQFFAGGQMSFDRAGVFAEGFEALPKPVQCQGPPIMIGGGSPKVLRLAGAKADVVSLNFDNSSGRIGPESVGSGSADQTAAKVRWVREGAGERAGDIELEIAAYFTSVTEKAADAIDRFSAALALPPEQVALHPHVLAGSVGAICDELERRRQAYGLSYITVGESVSEDFAPVVAQLSGH